MFALVLLSVSQDKGYSGSFITYLVEQDFVQIPAPANSIPASQVTAQPQSLRA